LLASSASTATSCTCNPHERLAILYICRINAHGYKKHGPEETKNVSLCQIGAEEAEKVSFAKQVRVT